MCGIAGLVSLDAESVRDRLTKMNDQMVHRGPDDRGIWLGHHSELGIGLAQRRLSIIDLSPSGHQPMELPDQSGVIVFNGEIYNYRELRASLEKDGIHFRGHSDTEVLLWGIRLYSTDFLSKLRGMYAFAYYDREKSHLLLARDPAGIKPLYYSSQKTEFAFASELNSLVQCGSITRRLSSQALSGFLAYGAVPQPLAFLEGVRMLPAGSWLRFECQTHPKLSRPETWWQLPVPDSQQTSDVVPRLRSLLESSVQEHLVADVPVGVFLSAGIDSTLIASMAKRFNNSVRAFTVDLAGTEGSDEADIASETASRIGIEHEVVRVSDEAAIEWMKNWLACTDQPSIDGLNTFIISKAVASCGIKVALAGLGADELFGGYSTFRDAHSILRVYNQLSFLPIALRRQIASLLSVGKSFEAREKLGDILTSSGGISRISILRRRLLSDSQLRGLGVWNTEWSHLSFLPEEMQYLFQTKESPGWQISRAEFSVYQQNMLLRDSDTNSMAHSLEIRVPFLDQRILDWVPTLPDDIRFPKNQSGKFLLREACKEYLGTAQLRRPKTGFTVPFTQWMAGPLKKVCEDKLKSIEQLGILKPEGVQSIWNHFMKTRTLASSTRALALVSLGSAVERLRL